MNLIKYNEMLKVVLKNIAYYLIVLVLSTVTVYNYPIFAIAIISSAFARRRPILPVYIATVISLAFFDVKGIGVLSAYMALLILLTTFIKPLNALENREEQKKIGNYMLFILVIMNIPFFTFINAVSLAFLTYAAYKILVNGFAVVVNTYEKVIFSKYEMASFYAIILTAIIVILSKFVPEAYILPYAYLAIITLIGIASYQDGRFVGATTLVLSIVSAYMILELPVSIYYLLITWLIYSELGLSKRQWILIGVILINIAAAFTEPIIQTAVLMVSVYIVIFTIAKEDAERSFLVKNALPEFKENRVEGTDVVDLDEEYYNKKEVISKENTISKMRKVTKGLTEKLTESFPKIKERLVSVLMMNNLSEENEKETKDAYMLKNNGSDETEKENLESKKITEEVVIKSKEEIFKDLEAQRQREEKEKKIKELRASVAVEVDNSVAELLNSLPELTLEVFESYEEKNKFMKYFLEPADTRSDLKLFEELIYRNTTRETIYVEYVHDIYVKISEQRMYEILLDNDILIVDPKDETFISDVKIINDLLENYMKNNEHRIREEIVKMIKLKALENVKNKIFKEEKEDDSKDPILKLEDKEELELEKSIKRRVERKVKKIKRVSIKKLAKDLDKDIEKEKNKKDN